MSDARWVEASKLTNMVGLHHLGVRCRLVDILAVALNMSKYS